MPRGRGTRARDARRNRPADVNLSDMIACYTIVELRDQRASETDFTKDLQDARLIVYDGGPHGITDAHKDRLNADLLAFVRGLEPRIRGRAARAPSCPPARS